MTMLYQTITRWVLYILFFLIPIFFLPWTTSALEINKQSLLVLLTGLALIAWVGSMVAHKTIRMRAGLLNLLPLGFLAAVFLSSLFSMAGYQTWVGHAAQEYTSFLSLISFVLLLYVLMNEARETAVQRGLLLALFGSSLIASVITLLGMFDLAHLPFALAQGTGFNTIGNVNAYIGFMGTLMFIGMAMWLVGDHGKDHIFPNTTQGILLKAGILLLTLVTLLSMIGIDYWLFWVMNIVAVVFLGGFAFLKTGSFPTWQRFLLPIIVLVISILLLVFPSPSRFGLPAVVTPSYGASWEIAKQTLASDWKRLLFGSGPGTFVYQYDQYKPVSVNGSIFWNTSFDRSKSHVITLLTTTGLLGLLTWLALLAYVGGRTLKQLLTQKDQEEWKMTFVLFIGWSVLVLYHFLYSSNFSLQFLLWALTGLLAGQLTMRLLTSDFRHAPRKGFAVSFFFVIVTVAVLAGMLVTGQRYMAEFAFAKALAQDRGGAPVEDVVGQLQKAVRYNGLSDIYHRNLSSALLGQAKAVAAGASGDEVPPEVLARVQELVQASVASASEATSIAPHNAANWSVRGSIYRDLLSFARDAEDFAAATYQRAIQLEPANPLHYTNLGRVLIAVADRARALTVAEDPTLAAHAAEALSTQLASAEAMFIRATELKPDYAPAHYYLASVYERQGKAEQARTRLEALRNAQPTNIGIGFQLALLYLRQQDLNLARGEFERLVTLNPNHSNTMWYLASVYELQGDVDKAVELVARVAELNPNNEGVQARLDRLRAGELTTRVPEPVEEGETQVVEPVEPEVVTEDVVE